MCCRVQYLCILRDASVASQLTAELAVCVLCTRAYGKPYVALAASVLCVSGAVPGWFQSPPSFALLWRVGNRIISSFLQSRRFISLVDVRGTLCVTVETSGV